MSNQTATPRSPAGLQPATRRWYRDVCRRWELEEHHVRLLVLACRAFDDAEAAAALVRKDGPLITMPSGACRPHPAVRQGNEARALFARLIRELDLDLDGPREAARPPQLRSIVGKHRAS